MRLPTPLYESLPYLYLMAGVLLVLLFSHNTGAMALAFLLYLAGSIVWIMRSGARRRDRREHRIFLSQMQRRTDRLYIPEWFYEEQPFIYLIISAICFYNLPNFAGILSGSLFAICSLTVMRSRVRNRSTTRTELTRA